MNFPLSQIPMRTSKPRESGLTMVMDKGLSLRETEDFIDSSGPFTDLVKLGFGSSFITQHLKKKIALYKKAKIPIYLGGTLLEAFIIRKQFKNFLGILDDYELEYAEVSDGSIVISHEDKCKIIRELSKRVTVISEVGSKEEGIIIHPARWIEMMQKEIDAGVWKVIAEARESGTVGIYRPSGKAHVVLINKIVKSIPPEMIIWEAPIKSQQVYMIKQFGANVNLGNISPNEVIALESLRLGLRSDTFFQFLETTSAEVKSPLS
jgi:phosphosulfolactate synthase